MTDTERSLRADPDALLSAIAKKKKKSRGGRLHLFFGMAPGVGKTYSMLLAAHEAKRNGADVVVAVVETHGRVETERLLNGLEILPKKIIEYRDRIFHEMDIDAVLERKPGLVLVDELAHTNIPGSRHNKRWQDVIELLDNGIDVYSTLNVQHLESRKDAVEEIAKITVSETVPDSILDRAYQIQLIDLSASDLLRRLKEGKVYLGEKAELAAANFFKEEKLTALREIALRLVAEKVDAELKTFVTEREAGASWAASDRLMVAVDSSKALEKTIRACRRIAFNLDANWIAVHIATNRVQSDKEKSELDKNLDLARSLGAEVVMAADTNVADGLIRIARQKDITQIIIGRATPRWWKFFLPVDSVAEQLMAKSTIDIAIIGPTPKAHDKVFARLGILKMRSTMADYGKAMAFTAGIIGVNALLEHFIGFRSVGFIFLLGILVLGIFLPIGPVMLAAFVTMLGWNFFFIPPAGNFHVSEPADIFLCVSYLVAALATGLLTRRNIYQQDILLNREARSEALRGILMDIAKEPTLKAVLASVISRIETFLDGRADIALLKKDRTIGAFLEERLSLSNLNREMAVAKWAVDNNKAAGKFTETLSSAEALYIPIKGLFGMMGVLGFQKKEIKTLSVEDKDFLFVVARQLAMSLESENFRKRALETDKLAESEKLHQTLLQLTAAQLKDSPLTVKAHEALMFMMDNFLVSSRLSVGIFPLKKEACDLKDMVNKAMEKLQFAFGDERISIESESALPKVLVERDLLIQAVANVLLNALQHCPHVDDISIELRPGEITIADRGPGVSEEEMGSIFDRFYRSPLSKIEGQGLGLAIAKGVVKAHEGKIIARNRAQGGFMITIILPFTAMEGTNHSMGLHRGSA